MKMLPKSAAALLGVTAIAALSTIAAHAYTTYAKWSSNTVSFYINPANADLDPALAEAALTSAMNNWNTQAGTPFRFAFAGRTNNTSTGYDGRNDMVFRNASNGSAIASTYSWYSGSTLVDADIVFWDASMAFTAGDRGCAGEVYLEDVTTHELGHALGLNHSSVGDATMYPSYSYCSQELRSLSADDIDGAQTLYGTSKTTNSAPSVSISSPSASSFAEGASITFAGSASDTQDGNISSQLIWTSNLVGQIGVGAGFTTTLPAGSHTITARATDSGGLSGQRQVALTVTAVQNTAPVVSISSPTATTFTEGTAIAFTGSANDTQDGNLTSLMVWTSSLVGQLGTGGTFSTVLPAGTHVITAAAADSSGLTGSKQLTISVSASVGSAVTQPNLRASGCKVKGAQRVDLTWDGMTASSTDVYRNGSKVAATPNDGFWTDALNVKGNGSYRYKVCETGTANCSAEVQVSF